jgi:predicted transposase/invertase (TIGR01784 family)
VQGQLWEELEETLKPILGDDYMLSIATALRQEGVEQGMQQGILQGMQQGMQQGVEKVAKSLLSRGMSVEFVADSTGIPVDLVVKLQKETRH